GGEAAWSAPDSRAACEDPRLLEASSSMPTLLLLLASLRPMDLGVDLGTTRTTVAVADRGNYPVVGFLDAEDDIHDWFPSVVARTGPGPDGLIYGYAALAAAAQGAPTVRSFKRALAEPSAGPHSELLV